MFNSKNTPHFTLTVSLRQNNGELERNVLKIVVNLQNVILFIFKMLHKMMPLWKLPWVFVLLGLQHTKLPRVFFLLVPQHTKLV